MNVNQIVILLLVLSIIGIALYHLFKFFQGRNAGTDLEEEDFSKNMRKVQVIDIRENDEFKAGHILGARNFPYTQLKELLPGLRKDKPIYLYGDNTYFANRATLLLHKAGFKDIYRLKGGYEGWTGRIKRGN